MLVKQIRIERIPFLEFSDRAGACLQSDRNVFPHLPASLVVREPYQNSPSLIAHIVDSSEQE